MRKLMLVLVALMLCVSCSSPDAKQDGFDFRKTRWGMDKEEVIKSEGRVPDSQVFTIIAYNDELFGRKASLSYTFTEDDKKLWSAMYAIDGYPEATFSTAVSALTDKYGNPKEKAVVAGMDVVRWSKRDTEISVIMNKSRDSVLISYHSEKMKKEHIQKDKERTRQTDGPKL